MVEWMMCACFVAVLFFIFLRIRIQGVEGADGRIFVFVNGYVGRWLAWLYGTFSQHFPTTVFFRNLVLVKKFEFEKRSIGERK